MEYKGLSKDIIAKIFNKKNIDVVSKIKHLDIGFTNDIYVINNKYILKVCVNEQNEKNFNRECFCYNYLKDIIPVPNIIVSDTSKNIIDRYYMIYKKIDGDNLYSKWHLFSKEDRKYIVRQLADIINSINTLEYRTFSTHFKMSDNIDWHNLRYSSLKEKLNGIKKNKLLDNNFISKIDEYISVNHNVLYEQKIGLTYTDLHFDNVLVLGNKVTALLDFEKTSVLSIDYALDTIKRLSEYPHLYACEKYEKFVKDEDYVDLIKWFKKFCPDVFKFKQLDTRLSLYSIEYDMRLLLKFPNSEGLKQRLARTVEYNYICCSKN
ncbi:phosphotransferase family protein [Abyssisolibacter fermentans]|uniref:phosphotransferase family protein n=1 Tax=Abyssisolibacter fermentans TaxID=1766203 RepID=UPI000831F53F|nr:phosphotransferase [Abyssisolibacter fermentans]